MTDFEVSASRPVFYHPNLVLTRRQLGQLTSLLDAPFRVGAVVRLRAPVPTPSDLSIRIGIVACPILANGKIIILTLDDDGEPLLHGQVVEFWEQIPEDELRGAGGEALREISKVIVSLASGNIRGVVPFHCYSGNHIDLDCLQSAAPPPAGDGI